MINYYQHDGGYIAVTDQSPAGFEGMVFVGRGGPINNISEQLYAADLLTDPVAVADVPPSWCNALGYHKVEDFPLLDESGENLLAEIPVRTPIVTTVAHIRRAKSKLGKLIFGGGDVYWQAGLMLSIVIFIIWAMNHKQ